MIDPQADGKAEREAEMRRAAFPAYATSVGWYVDELHKHFSGNRRS